MRAVSRRVFLDDVATEDAIRAQLDELVRRARQEGDAVAIGHPYPVTLVVLEKELPELAKRGVRLREGCRSSRRSARTTTPPSSRPPSTRRAPSSAPRTRPARSRAPAARRRRSARGIGGSPAAARLGVDLAAAREVDDREQEVADLVRLGAGVARFRGRAPLPDLLLDLRDDVRIAFPVEPEVRGAQRLAVRRRERRQRRRGGFRAGPRGAAGLAALASLPCGLDLLWRLEPSSSPKTWGWRSIIFSRDAVRDRVDPEPAPLLREPREKEDLEEQIAELVAQRRRLALVERLRGSRRSPRAGRS